MFNSKALEKFTQREKRQFQEMLGLYDEKVYAKSIALGDKLLENNPTHAETRAFRALSVSGLGKIKEAVKEMKLVLMKNMMNYTCWHIMGIIHRKDKEYDQARRAYLFALKCDPTSEQTMRELLQLQVHLRDFPGFEHTSRQLLLQKPSVTQNWVTLATACCANRNYSGCMQAIESIIRFQDEQGSKSRLKPHELSEVVLLALRALERQDKHNEALTFLKKHDSMIVDLQAKLNVQGRLNAKLGNEYSAVDCFERLLELNSANLGTYKKLIEAKGVVLPADIKDKLSEAYQNILKGILEEYAQAFPRTNTPIRIGLRYLWGDSFQDFLERFMRPLMIKGVPSLLQDLRELYACPEKVAIIEAHLKACTESMETERTLRAGDDEEQAASLTTRLGEQDEAARNVWLAVRTHRILAKSGVAGLDSAFKAKAKEVYPNSTYFAAQ